MKLDAQIFEELKAWRINPLPWPIAYAVFTHTGHSYIESDIIFDLYKKGFMKANIARLIWR